MSLDDKSKQEENKVKMDIYSSLTYKPRKKYRNLLTRMENELSEGPFSILYRSLDENLRVRVWTRSYNHVRGICTGYLVAYDKHWNMALYDVDEVYRNPRCLLPTKGNKPRKKKKKKNSAKIEDKKIQKKEPSDPVHVSEPSQPMHVSEPCDPVHVSTEGSDNNEPAKIRTQMKDLIITDKNNGYDVTTVDEVKVKAGDNVKVIAEDDLKVWSGDDVKVNAEVDVKVKAGDDVKVMAGDYVKVMAEDDVKVKAGDDVKAVADDVKAVAGINLTQKDNKNNDNNSITVNVSDGNRDELQCKDPCDVQSESSECTESVETKDMNTLMLEQDRILKELGELTETDNTGDNTSVTEGLSDGEIISTGSEIINENEPGSQNSNRLRCDIASDARQVRQGEIPYELKPDDVADSGDDAASEGSVDLDTHELNDDFECIERKDKDSSQKSSHKPTSEINNKERNKSPLRGKSSSKSYKSHDLREKLLRKRQTDSGKEGRKSPKKTTRGNIESKRDDKKSRSSSRDSRRADKSSRDHRDCSSEREGKTRSSRYLSRDRRDSSSEREGKTRSSRYLSRDKSNDQRHPSCERDEKYGQKSYNRAGRSEGRKQERQRLHDSRHSPPERSGDRRRSKYDSPSERHRSCDRSKHHDSKRRSESYTRGRIHSPSNKCHSSYTSGDSDSDSKYSKKCETRKRQMSGKKTGKNETNKDRINTPPTSGIPSLLSLKVVSPVKNKQEPEVLQRHVNQLFIRGDNVVMVSLVQ